MGRNTCQDKWGGSRSRQKKPLDLGTGLTPMKKEGGQKILSWGSSKKVSTRMVRSPQPTLPVNGFLHPIGTGWHLCYTDVRQEQELTRAWVGKQRR